MEGTNDKQSQLRAIGKRFGVREPLLEAFIQTMDAFTGLGEGGSVRPVNSELTIEQLASEIIETNTFGPRPEWASLYTRTAEGVAYDIDRVLQRLEIAEGNFKWTQVGMLALLRGIPAADIDKFAAFADRHFALDITGTVVLRDDASLPLDEAVAQVVEQFKAQG